MISKFINFCKNYGFEIILAIIVSIIIIYSLYRTFKGEKGNWSKNYYTYSLNDINSYKLKSSNKKGAPKESKGETECKRVLEKIFNKPFNKSRPNFLNNPVTGGNHNLELDCYNEEIGLALEYDGEAHAKYIPYFHKNKEAFYNQKYRDYMKDMMCKENGIVLIRVPHTVKLNNIEEFIMNKLQNYN